MIEQQKTDWSETLQWKTMRTGHNATIQQQKTHYSGNNEKNTAYAMMIDGCAVEIDVCMDFGLPFVLLVFPLLAVAMPCPYPTPSNSQFLPLLFHFLPSSL